MLTPIAEPTQPKLNHYNINKSDEHVTTVWPCMQSNKTDKWTNRNVLVTIMSRFKITGKLSASDQRGVNSFCHIRSCKQHVRVMEQVWIKSFYIFYYLQIYCQPPLGAEVSLSHTSLYWNYLNVFNITSYHCTLLGRIERVRVGLLPGAGVSQTVMRGSPSGTGLYVTPGSGYLRVKRYYQIVDLTQSWPVGIKMHKSR